MVRNIYTAVIVQITLISISVCVASENEACGPVKRYATISPSYITSPGFPRGYDRNVSCQWEIYTNTYNTIQLEAVETDLDKRWFRSCSNRDHVKVLDGTPPNAALLGYICGSQSPTFTSIQHAVTIKFRSRETGEGGKGFKLKYIAGQFTYKTYSTVSLLATSDPDTFSQPTVIYDDYRFVKMSWRIRTDHGQQIYIRTISSSLSGHSCDRSGNYMEAFDGYDADSASLGKWCSGQLVEKQATGTYMYILLYAKLFNRDCTFVIEYGLKPAEATGGVTLGVGGIAGISVGVIAFIGITYIAIKIMCSRCNDKLDEESIPDRDRDMPSSISLMEDPHDISTPHRTTPVPSAPPDDLEIYPQPPSYDEVMGQLK